MTDASQIGPEYRRSSLERLKTEAFDVVIVGGGVTGCGAALDAASRGIKVALVEQRDYAAGTSSRSSKMFHGGLRYLEQLEFGLVREALRERNLMVSSLCPYLATPTRFLYPLTHRYWERLYVGAGVLLYDALATLGEDSLPGHSHHTKKGALALAPGIRPDTLVGAVSYSDVVVDDARHTAILARTAASYGAAMITSARVVDVIKDAGSVGGVVVRDLESADEFDLRASVVVNTTGVWTDQIEELAGDRRTNVRASKGIHIVVPRSAIDLEIGVILPTEKSVLFIIPWKHFWIIGTTDTDWNLHKAHPAASRTDIDYLLEHVNKVLRNPLSHDDLLGVYAGLRPLLKGESDATSKLSREHSVRKVKPGLISVAGGKYTTYRVMAMDAIDAAVGEIGRSFAPSHTATIPLVGASRDVERGLSLDLSPREFEHLTHRYGDRAGDIFDLIGNDRTLGAEITGSAPYLRAEVVYGVTHEGALHLDDILTRRTRISIETKHRGTDSAREVAQLMAGPLGWDQETIDREVEHYLARVAAERDSQLEPDDATADASRMGAPDVRLGG
jgi:glycerol-3-phosphate dehydrogenase